MTWHMYKTELRLFIKVFWVDPHKDDSESTIEYKKQEHIQYKYTKISR